MPTEDVQRRSLGLRPSVPLEPAQLRSLVVLEGFDLSAIRDRLVRNETISPVLVDEVILEFRRYLAVRLLAERPIAMLSRPVDEVWHTALLFTRLYAELCQSVFGQFVHHDPTRETQEVREASWEEFEQAYSALFGSPGPLWQLWRPDLF